MSYRLEKTTPEDWERIVSDIKSDSEKFVESVVTKNFFTRFISEGVDTWVIDRDDNSYLFRGPRFMIAPGLRTFSFFYQGSLYWLALDSYGYSDSVRNGGIIRFFSPNKKHIEPSNKRHKRFLKQFKFSIKDALSVLLISEHGEENGRFNLFFQEDLENHKK